MKKENKYKIEAARLGERLAAEQKRHEDEVRMLTEDAADVAKLYWAYLGIKVGDIIEVAKPNDLSYVPVRVEEVTFLRDWKGRPWVHAKDETITFALTVQRLTKNLDTNNRYKPDQVQLRDIAPAFRTWE